MLFLLLSNSNHPVFQKPPLFTLKMLFFAAMECSDTQKTSVQRKFPRQVKITRNRPMKGLYISLGVLATAVGFVGIFVPVLPTTAFLLLAAWCFARSSERFYNRLLGNRLFGKYLTSYLEGRGVPVKTKILSLTMLWITILSSVVFFVDNLWVDILLIIIAAGVTFHIVTLPAYKG